MIKEQKVHSGFVSPNIGNTPVMGSTVKRRLVVSFSGGRTSAFMLWWLLNEWEDRHNWEIIVVFANTGKEVEGTLFFVDECSQEWGIQIIWVEAKCKDKNGNPYSEKGWQVKHKVVNYETASRNGEPFEEMISVLGIPSENAPFCSYQLKKKAIESYIESIGWDDYHIAIGVRIDEPDRLNEDWENKKIFYPLAGINPKKKRDIILWWNKQSFNLNIHKDDGNCDNCWKKNLPLLVRNFNRNSKSFNWWEEMTLKYGHINPRNVDLKPPFNFYRKNMSVLDIKKLSDLSQAQLQQLTMFEESYGCEESCEVW